MEESVNLGVGVGGCKPPKYGSFQDFPCFEPRGRETPLPDADPIIWCGSGYPVSISPVYLASLLLFLASGA